MPPLMLLRVVSWAALEKLEFLVKICMLKISLRPLCCFRAPPLSNPRRGDQKLGVEGFRHIRGAVHEIRVQVCLICHAREAGPNSSMIWAGGIHTHVIEVVPASRPRRLPTAYACGARGPTEPQQDWPQGITVAMLHPCTLLERVFGPHLWPQRGKEADNAWWSLPSSFSLSLSLSLPLSLSLSRSLFFCTMTVCTR